MRKIIHIVGLLFIFVSCQSKQERLIVHWEAITNNCKIISVESIQQIKIFRASDSIILLKYDYQSLKHERILQLQTEIDTLKKALVFKAREFQTIQNPTMKRYFKHGLERMEGRVELLESNIGIYKKQPELTQLKVIDDKIESYQRDSARVLGRLFEIRFIGKQGALQKQMFVKQYFFQNNMDKILEEL